MWNACSGETLTARRNKVINRDYDIPYIAGYSQDGHTVFIDRHLPRSFQWLMKTVRVEPFLLTHEIVEKALLDELHLHYLHAHQIALRAERDAVKAAGVSWWAYQRFMKQHEKATEEEKLIKVPANLDHTYRDVCGIRAPPARTWCRAISSGSSTTKVFIKCDAAGALSVHRQTFTQA